ncbi:MAG: hypothetical protein KQH59_21890 [Desulfobulbaceae bacterium]|nr:hypothetical protein [Desulfobulbaceae bacterium]
MCQSRGDSRGIKDFITVLKLYREYAASEVEAAVELALEKGISSSEGVRHLLVYANETVQPATPLAGWERLPPADITPYGQLGGIL